MAERRSLWGDISMSEKVNKLSVSAALLYTWTIPHLDDFGWIEADQSQLKGKVVPIRSEKSFSKGVNLQKLIDSILNVHRLVNSNRPLWTLHTVNGKGYIHDEYFEERQTFKGVHRKPSKIKSLVESTLRAPNLHPISTQQVQSGAKWVPKLSEVKGSEVEVPLNVENSVEISTPAPSQDDDGKTLSLSTQEEPKPKPIDTRLDTRTDQEFEDSLQETYPLIFEKTMAEINEFLDNNPDTLKDPNKRRKFILVKFMNAQKAKSKQVTK